MITIAVTGGIACGKSTVGDFLRGAGVAVCDADDLAHAAMLPGGGVFAGVVQTFGDGVVGADGRIDRRALGDIVFASESARRQLNALVHPDVKRRWLAWLAKQRAEAAAVIVPLLFEEGLEKPWDVTVCVVASRRLQLARLLERGLGRAAAAARIAAMMPLNEKVRLADYVLVNEGSRDVLKRQTERMLRRILEK
jgi:dephospho-CoA kinase